MRRVLSRRYPRIARYLRRRGPAPPRPGGARAGPPAAAAGGGAPRAPPPRDAITYASTVPHRLSNRGDEPAEAIWFQLA
jgi:hypothetical protein